MFEYIYVREIPNTISPWFLIKRKNILKGVGNTEKDYLITHFNS